MLSISVLCVGKLRERHYISACEEYAKRLGAFCRFETVELTETRLPENPSPAEVENALKREAAAIEKAVPKGAWVCALCIEGRKLSSAELAELLSVRAVGGDSKLCFIIGGSFGLHDAVKTASDLRLSMSDMTFPHHLARVMLCEQIYRAMSINAGTRYHK